MKALVPKKNKEFAFTREELLGATEEKAFTLGDSEVVVGRVLDFLIKLTVNTARLRYVDSLMNDYVIDDTLGVLNRLVDINSMMPDAEKEHGVDLFEFNVTKPKIDNWAINKTNIITVKSDIQTTTDLNVSSLSNGSRTYRQILPTMNRLLSGIRLTEKEVKAQFVNTTNINANDYSSTSSITNNKFGNQSGGITVNGNINNKKIDKKKDDENLNLTRKKTIVSSPIKKKEYEDLEQYALEDLHDKSENMDELEKLREKAFRAYFKEKEIEREKKRKLDKESEEKSKEEEKRRKKILEDLIKKPISYDFEGKLIFVNPVDQNKLVQSHPKPNTKVKDKIITENGIIKNIELHPLSIYPDNKKTNIKNNNNNQKKITPIEFVVVPTEEMEVVRTKYYQPDPIVSHVIQAGVTMDCFGVKKTGGKFKEIPNKLSQDEFLALLTKYKPKKSKVNTMKYNVVYQDYLNILKIDNMEIPEEQEINENETKKLSRLLQMDLRDSINDEGEIVNKKTIPRKHFIIGLTRPDKEKLNEIRKKEMKNTINTMNEFNIEEYLPEDTEKLYEIFKYFNEHGGEGPIVQKDQTSKLPIDLHSQIEKEKAYLKKNPRERLSREMIASKIKVKVVKLTSVKEDATLIKKADLSIRKDTGQIKQIKSKI